MLDILRDQKGQSTVIVVGAMVVMLGFAALAIDMGMLYVNRAKLVNIADAAALAGAQELPRNGLEAKAAASNFATSNGLTAADNWNNPIVNIAKTRISVTTSRSVPLFFANVLGMSSANVSATATAQIFPMSAAGNNTVVPIGVLKDNWVEGQVYELKQAAGNSTTGNFACLNLPDVPGGLNHLNGAQSYEMDLRNGYEGTLKIDQDVPTEPGNKSGATKDGVNSRTGDPPDSQAADAWKTEEIHSPRLVVVPVITALPNGASAPVTIIGFASFYLLPVSGSGNDNVIYAVFTNIVKGAVSTTDDPTKDFGAYGVKLVE